MKRRASRSSSPARKLAPLGGYLLLLLLAFSVVVWRQTRAVEIERALAELDAQAAVVAEQRVQLERQIRDLTRRERITKLAQRRFGMEVPEAHRVIVLTIAADGANGQERW